MPELPEVERGRSIAERVARNRVVTRVWTDDDRIVFDGVAPRRFAATLLGRRVEAVHRHGKQLWFTLDAGPHPLFHFGMSGAFVTPGAAPLRLESNGRVIDVAWPPRFVKVHITFDDGGELAMTNARRFGRIRLRDDPSNEPPIAGLGFDPLHGLPSLASMSGAFARRRIAIKSLLLDQSFAAGVGNWIADEVLYRARVDPRRRACDLDEPSIRRIRTCLGRVVEQAVAVDADKAKFPRTWLYHHRWGRTDGATTGRGEPIRHDDIGGRTTAWVPSVQR